MAAKQIVFDTEAREKLAHGIEKLAKAVVSTLGPKGRTAVLDKGWGAPNITKDGVTVAEEIELTDPYENCAAQMVRQVASKTSDVAGDGTTTATLLADAIFREGLRHVISGANVGVPSPGSARVTQPSEFNPAFRAVIVASLRCTPVAHAFRRLGDALSIRCVNTKSLKLALPAAAPLPPATPPAWLTPHDQESTSTSSLCLPSSDSPLMSPSFMKMSAAMAPS